MDYGQKSIKEHERKIAIKVIANAEIKTRDDLSIYYTPGIAAVSKEIAADKDKIYTLTSKRNSVAVVTDGSAVLGLGNIGAEAALPVMEGKALLFAEFAGISAVPICLKTQDTGEIINTVRNIAPAFGGINLEDIAAPRCFEIEDTLQDLGIPVMHDDQHGTAIVVLAGLINALKVAKKDIAGLKIIISGAGAAGTAIAKMILEYSKNKASLIILDSKGAICDKRQGLTKEKQELEHITLNKICGSLAEVIKGADVFVGVSAPGILTKEMVKSMNKKAIIFAMANPVPEIDPAEARKAGAFIVATGRSDYPNQVNNVLAFPGIFRGALDARAAQITPKMKLAAALALAEYIEKPTADNIIPGALDRNVAVEVAKAVIKAV